VHGGCDETKLEQKIKIDEPSQVVVSMAPRACSALLLLLARVAAVPGSADPSFWDPEAWPEFSDARDALVLQELSTIDSIARDAARLHSVASAAAAAADSDGDDAAAGRQQQAGADAAAALMAAAAAEVDGYDAFVAWRAQEAAQEAAAQAAARPAAPAAADAASEAEEAAAEEAADKAGGKKRRRRRGKGGKKARRRRRRAMAGAEERAAAAAAADAAAGKFAQLWKGMTPRLAHSGTADSCDGAAAAAAAAAAGAPPLGPRGARARQSLLSHFGGCRGGAAAWLPTALRYYWGREPMLVDALAAPPFGIVVPLVVPLLRGGLHGGGNATAAVSAAGAASGGGGGGGGGAAGAQFRLEADVSLVGCRSEKLCDTIGEWLRRYEGEGAAGNSAVVGARIGMRGLAKRTTLRLGLWAPPQPMAAAASVGAAAAAAAAAGAGAVGGSASGGGGGGGDEEDDDDDDLVDDGDDADDDDGAEGSTPAAPGAKAPARRGLRAESAATEEHAEWMVSPSLLSIIFAPGAAAGQLHGPAPGYLFPASMLSLVKQHEPDPSPFLLFVHGYSEPAAL
jgi:hypothetical protein